MKAVIFGKKVATLLFILALCTVAAVPQQVNYQGKLTDPDGVAFEGVYTITFSIYDVESSGSALWTENQDVTLAHGLFDVRLGTVFPIALDFSEPYWVELSIGGETLEPRQPLSTVPYAFRAAIADSVVGGGGSDTDWEWSSGSGLTGNIYHTGRVAVGTTTPWAKLHIVSDGSEGIIVERDDQVSINVRGFGATAYPIVGGMRARGSSSSPAAVQADDHLLLIDGSGYYTGSTGGTGVGINLIANENWSLSSRGGRITFVGHSDGTAGPLEEWMRLVNSNVGIGTTNPQAKLSVGGDGVTNIAVYGYMSSNNYGYLGDETQGRGVYGTGTNIGVVGISNVGKGLSGSGTIGVWSEGKTGGYGVFANPVPSGATNFAAIYGSDAYVGPSPGAVTDKWAAYFVGALRMTPQSPTGPTQAGAMYYDDDDNKMYYYNGSTWVEMGGGSGSGSDTDWTISTAIGDGIYDTTLVTGGEWGLFRDGNIGYGDACSTHVNLGVDCTTGVSGQNNKYCTISGGMGNSVDTIGGTVSGGTYNSSSSQGATVGGGVVNVASGRMSTISGGFWNTISETGVESVIGGGQENDISGERGTIAGGLQNTVGGFYCSIGGGRANIASNEYSVVSGGYENNAAGNYSVIPGGFSNTSRGDYSFAFGNNLTVSTNYTSQFYSPSYKGILRAYGDLEFSDMLLGGIGSADSFWIYDDGDTTRFDADNPIKIGDASLIVETDGDVRATQKFFVGDVPDDATADSILTIDGGQVKKVAASSLSGADGDWQIGSGMIYNTTDDVGIGTATPTQKLHVHGGNIRLTSTSEGSKYIYFNGGQAYITTELGDPLHFQTNMTTRMTILSTGNVGIGTEGPDYDLDVRERMGIASSDESNFLTISAASTYGPTLRFNSDDDLIINSGLNYSGLSSSTERMRLTGDGNLGIGSNAPLSVLSINGDGAAHYGVFIEGPETSVDYQAALYIHSNNFSSDPAGIYNKYHGIYVDQEPATSGVYHPSAIYGNMSNITTGYSTGVLGRAMGTGTSGGRTYGVKGYAGGGSDNYNYAVYGELFDVSDRQGTAILGYDAIDHSGFDGTLLRGNWAGYFHGNIVTTDRTYFGDTDVYIRQDASNNMALRDPNTNGGTEVTLSDLYSGVAFIQNQSSTWQDGWFQIQKRITTTQDAVAEIDFSANIGASPGYGSAYGLNVTSDTLQDKGIMIGVLASTAIAPVGHVQSGGASGRLAYITGYNASGRMVGVDGHSYPAVLDNFDGTTMCFGIGVRGNVTPPSTLTLDATGTYWIGGVMGEVNGAVNTTPANGAVAGVIGVDNNTGTATSYAGYFDGDVLATGEIRAGTIVIRGESETNDATIRYRHVALPSWDYQEERRINYGRSTSLTAGYWDYFAYRKTRTLIKFDVSEIPSNATIVSAEMKLYCYNYEGSGTYGVYKLRRHWDEGDFYCGRGEPTTFGHCDSTGITGGCAWDNYSANSAWGTAGADNTTSDRYSTSEENLSISSTGWKSWDIASAIQDVVDGTSESYGFIIIGPSSGHNRAYFKSSECAEFELKPRLEIEWIY